MIRIEVMGDDWNDADYCSPKPVSEIGTVEIEVEVSCEGKQGGGKKRINKCR